MVYSRSWEEHLTHIASVLGALKAAGLTANPTCGGMKFTVTDVWISRPSIRPGTAATREPTCKQLY